MPHPHFLSREDRRQKLIHKSHNHCLTHFVCVVILTVKLCNVWLCSLQRKQPRHTFNNLSVQEPSGRCAVAAQGCPAQVCLAFQHGSRSFSHPISPFQFPPPLFHAAAFQVSHCELLTVPIPVPDNAKATGSKPVNRVRLRG